MGKWETTLVRVEETATASLLAMMSGATFLNVIARYVFNSPVEWAEEFSRYSFIWLVFMAAVVATTQKKHIIIDILVPFLSARLQAVCRLVADLAILVLMAVLIVYGWVMVRAATQPMATLGFPQYWVYLAVPVCAALILLHVALDLCSGLRAARGGGSQP
jgi:TRAP-type C4-dicarboxylate transport system permease small subunit